MIAALRVGETVKIKIIRDGQEKEVSLSVAERKEQAEVAAAGETGQAFGMVVQEITPEIARHLGLSTKTGVIVVDVQEGSTADEVGIQPQDIILQVNRVKISSMKEYVAEIGKAGDKGILLLIKRGKSTFFVPLAK